MSDGLTPSIACFLVAYDCGLKAVKIEPQVIFADGGTWFWWIAAFGWSVFGIRCFGLTRK